MLFDWRVLRAFNRGTRILLLVCALDAFGYFGVQAVLFNLYLLRLGVGAPFIGLLIASGQLVWALAAFPAAALSRRLGVRAALILAFALAALGMGVVLLVDGLPRPLWTGGLAAGPCCGSGPRSIASTAHPISCTSRPPRRARMRSLRKAPW